MGDSRRRDAPRGPSVLPHGRRLEFPRGTPAARPSGGAMSEYQYYEFVAIDRPLDGREQAEVRSLSTRARITATSFVNEYHWGDFSGDPNVLMDRYYDAHLYVANWGTRRVMFRLPGDLLDI